MRLTSANADSNLFCRLFIACQSREGNVDEFFKHENNMNPPSISEFGKIRTSAGGPDELVKCFYKSGMLENPASKEDISASTWVVNASSLSLDLPPKSDMTVKEYSETVFNKIINSKCETYKRIDVVFECRQEQCLIAKTSENSVASKYLSLIDNDTKLPSNKKLFTNFFTNWTIRDQFLKLLESNLVQDLNARNETRIYSTKNSIIVISDASDREVTNFESITVLREETNATLLLHVENAVHNGHDKIIVYTSDFNVIVVAIYAFKYLRPIIKKL